MGSDGGSQDRGGWKVAARISLLVGIVAGVLAIVQAVQPRESEPSTPSTTEGIPSFTADVTRLTEAVQFISWLEKMDGRVVQLRLDCRDDSDTSLCHYLSALPGETKDSEVEINTSNDCASSKLATTFCESHVFGLYVRIPQDTTARLGLGEGAGTWRLTGKFRVTDNGTAGFIGWRNFDLLAQSS
jgi:hypothetical protein